MMTIKIDDIHEWIIEKKENAYEVTFTEYGKKLGSSERWQNLDDVLGMIYEG